MTTPTVRRWPLLLIGAPAAVSIWGGWVGLGGMAGFGPVRLLPGILPHVVINLAICLPVGVEAYGAYALGAWLRPGTPDSARRFARWSAIGSLLLGMCGQVSYHLLAAAHSARAPWPVTVAVSCVPVVALGFGAALIHLLRAAPAADSVQSPVHRPHDLAAPLVAALAARISPARDSAGSTPRDSSQVTARDNPEGDARDTSEDSRGVTARDIVQAVARAPKTSQPDRSEWPSARGMDHADLLKRTRSEVRKWERSHEPGERLPAIQLPDLLRLRMSRTTAGKLLDDVYKPHLVSGTGS
jgi:hypothetical protein